MSSLEAAVSRRMLRAGNLRRSASTLQPPASSTEAIDAGPDVLGAAQAAASGVEPGAAVNFGVEPDTMGDSDTDSLDEAVVLEAAVQRQIGRACALPSEPCNCALVEKFLCRDDGVGERRRCVCAFCGILYGPSTGPQNVRCRNIVPDDLVQEYDANYCRLCRDGHCRQHFEWVMRSHAAMRASGTGRPTLVCKPPLVRIEPALCVE